MNVYLLGSNRIRTCTIGAELHTYRGSKGGLLPSCTGRSHRDMDFKARPVPLQNIDISRYRRWQALRSHTCTDAERPLFGAAAQRCPTVQVSRDFTTFAPLAADQRGVLRSRSGLFSDCCDGYDKWQLNRGLPTPVASRANRNVYWSTAVSPDEPKRGAAKRP